MRISSDQVEQPPGPSVLFHFILFRWGVYAGA